jgi:hypothetical protein
MPGPDQSEIVVDRPDRPGLAAAPADTGLSLVTPEQLALELGVGPPTLRRWRKQRVGPPYAQHGRNVWPRRAAVEAWLVALEQDCSQ